MEFEFDPIKSESNRKKHGIDFVDAQLLWLDSMLLEIPARVADESVIGVGLVSLPIVKIEFE